MWRRDNITHNICIQNGWQYWQEDGVALKELNSLEKGFNQLKCWDLIVK